MHGDQVAGYKHKDDIIKFSIINMRTGYTKSIEFSYDGIGLNYTMGSDLILQQYCYYRANGKNYDDGYERIARLPTRYVDSNCF